MAGGYSTGTERLYPVAIKTGNYTIALTDFTILCTNSSAITITLPTAVSMLIGNVSHRFEIKRDITAAAVTVDGDGSDQIEGAGTYNLAAGESITVISNGTALYII